MTNGRIEEIEIRIRIAGRNINNLKTPQWLLEAKSPLL